VDGLAVRSLSSGESCFALALEHLHPDRELVPDLVTREMVALITALEGERDVRIVLQTLARPDQKNPEQGTLQVHLIGVVAAVLGADPDQQVVHQLAEDIQDLVGSPPLRWSFRPVNDPGELDGILEPLPNSHFAEITRREEQCQPVSMTRSMGFQSTGDPIDRRLWSLWTFGTPSTDLRRHANALLSQSSPICIRVVLAPTALTDDEREGIEQLASGVATMVPGDGLIRASLRTVESMLYLRPLFEMRCIVASPDPMSRTMLSSIGNAISEPAQHGQSSTILSGGFAVLRGGIETPREELASAFQAMQSTSVGTGLAPPNLRRLRRLMGAWEAAHVFRLPVADDDVFPGLERLDVPDLKPPFIEPSSDGSRLGRVVGRWDRPVLLAPEERFRHLYVSGQTGTGKSTLLFNLALQDIQSGAGVAVLDPHGDLVEALLDCIPEERLDDVVLVDPADPVAVVGVNLLEAETTVQREYVIAELCGMFYALFDPNNLGIVGPRYESWLRQAAGLLLARVDQPSSMLDIPTVFTDKAVQKHLVTGLTDPILSEFWLGEMAQTSDYHRSEVLGWFRSKFEVFRTSALVRNVIGQAKSTISFSEILRERRILLVNLSKGLLGEYNSAMLGHVMFTRLWGAALERASVPVSERPDFFMYIDEFQNMTTSSLPDVLSEARKFRVGLTLANQFFSQVNELTRDAIMGNVGSRVTFRLGPKDSTPFATWMGREVEPDDLTTLPNFHAIASLSHRGVPLDPFVMRSDPPSAAPSSDRGHRARERSRANWARPVAELDLEFFGRWAHVKGSFAQLSNQAVPVPQPSSAPSQESNPPATTGRAFLDDWLGKRRQSKIDDEHSTTTEEETKRNDDES